MPDFGSALAFPITAIPRSRRSLPSPDIWKITIPLTFATGWGESIPHPENKALSSKHPGSLPGELPGALPRNRPQSLRVPARPRALQVYQFANSGVPSNPDVGLPGWKSSTVRLFANCYLPATQFSNNDSAEFGGASWEAFCVLNFLRDPSCPLSQMQPGATKVCHSRNRSATGAK